MNTSYLREGCLEPRTTVSFLKLEGRTTVPNHPNKLVTAVDRFGSHTVNLLESLFLFSTQYYRLHT